MPNTTTAAVPEHYVCDDRVIGAIWRLADKMLEIKLISLKRLTRARLELA